jgi:hypothetical protein
MQDKKPKTINDALLAANLGLELLLTHRRIYSKSEPPNPASATNSLALIGGRLAANSFKYLSNIQHHLPEQLILLSE